jgi:cation:H+ antiporter
MLRREIPVMLLVMLLLWPVLHNLYLSRPEGFGLLAVFAGLILLTVYMARKDKKLATENAENMDSCFRRNDKGKSRNDIKSIVFVVIGLAGLALGADITVRGGVFIGERVGLSKAVIGLTIMAIGTSLPELVTCVVAAVKGQDDISVGTIVGSNIFNALLALGIAGVVRPFELVRRLAGVDYWILIIVSAGFVLMALVGKRISRINGIILLCGYVAYIVYLLAFSI